MHEILTYDEYVINHGLREEVLPETELVLNQIASALNRGITHCQEDRKPWCSYTTDLKKVIIEEANGVLLPKGWKLVIDYDIVRSAGTEVQYILKKYIPKYSFWNRISYFLRKKR